MTLRVRRMSLRVPKDLLESRRNDVVTLLRLGAGLNGMAALIRSVGGVGYSLHVDIVTHNHAVLAALACFGEIVRTIERTGFEGRLFELVEMGLPFDGVGEDLPVAEARRLLSPTHPDIGSDVLLKIRNKITFHWDPVAFQSFLDDPRDTVIDFWTSEICFQDPDPSDPFIVQDLVGDPPRQETHFCTEIHHSDRIFTASHRAVMAFASDVPNASKTLEDLVPLLVRAARVVGRVLEVACLGLAAEARGGSPPLAHVDYEDIQ